MSRARLHDVGIEGTVRGRLRLEDTITMSDKLTPLEDHLTDQVSELVAHCDTYCERIKELEKAICIYLREEFSDPDIETDAQSLARFIEEYADN